MNRAYLKNYLLCGLITFLIAATTYPDLQLNGHTDYSLLNAVLPRFTICLALVPTLLITILATLDFRVNDVLRCQTRKVLVWEIVYRAAAACVLMCIIWLVGNVGVILVTNSVILLNHIFKSLILRLLYLWTCCFALGLIAATAYAFIKNKILAFFIVFVINSFSFSLNRAKKISLFYDFIVPDFEAIVWSRFLVLLAIIFVVGTLLAVIIEKRDF
ncbi:hypothetical protein PT285_03090 [Lactobacillus sp. ESL0791]|uniref:hypothetical protein n=1 Tax=Lactobacillus sp. ESL0791 TaxID=2983234 RepID=UPI0023F71A7F|nr:hypothetical protein [Lactobacillus sp. ESL0791]MDF7638420.1 hypothetical protein [Lactobacillus sp. ESL0791]